MSEVTVVKDSSTVKMNSRGAVKFKLPLTDIQRDEILVALAIKGGIIQVPEDKK